MTDCATVRWRDPVWIDSAAGWATDRLAEHGHAVAGEPEQVHVRPWSTLLRLPTGDGAFWFKANAIGTAHEGPLIEALARWSPGHHLEPLAIDARQGWLLLPDGGVTLRAAQGGATDIAHWAEILTDHAELLDDEGALRVGVPGGHYRLFDWGDASVAHPFAVLLIALRVAQNLHHLSAGDLALLRLRDVYLEPWTAEFDRSTLVEATRLALRVGGVSRALSYRSALIEGTQADHDEYGDGVPQWLLECYVPTPLDPEPW